MTPTPWAQAVEAIRKNLSGLCCDGPGCDLCMEVAQDIAKESLPHLLRAWVAGLTDEQLWELGAEEWYPYDRKPNGGGMRAGVPTPTVMRKRLLSALTDAAGRVDAVTLDSHIGDHA